MSDLEDLMGRYGVELAGKGGDAIGARDRLDLSKRIAVAYPGFFDIKTAIGGGFPLRASQLGDLAWRLSDARLLRRRAANNIVSFEPTDQHARSYLMGGWLEELLWAAMLAAGVDDARFAQPVRWQVGETEGYNELDVVACKDEHLVFVSCKTTPPEFRNTDSKRQTFRNFLYEAHYWDSHFADGGAKIVLAVSTDLVDEQRNEHRFPTFQARAEKLDVLLLSLEDLAWARLVDRLAGFLGQHEN